MFVSIHMLIYGNLCFRNYVFEEYGRSSQDDIHSPRLAAAGLVSFLRCLARYLGLPSHLNCKN